MNIRVKISFIALLLCFILLSLTEATTQRAFLVRQHSIHTQNMFGGNMVKEEEEKQQQYHQQKSRKIVCNVVNRQHLLHPINHKEEKSSSSNDKLPYHCLTTCRLGLGL
uniref:Uncharacterized protein n=1 Tax=Ditylum brightwellii TaxID=49249 RepID=A0A6V2EZG8_9STRA|mmetsp:Transcript_20524/g.29771  ORF Transcript_20524/g.29771 Transcript_20524/m.29771 type:complete len:109 (-) Transcript_20524:306-632(-)